MEALPSLPPELAAFAAPMARGAAPLLGSTEADTELDGAALPFDLYLALMTAPQPTGEAWPATGKELPLATPVAASAQPPATLSAASAGDAALLARLNLAAEDAGGKLPGTAPLPLLSADALSQPRPPSGAQPASPLAEATPQSATLAGSAAAMPAELLTAAAPDLAELAAQPAPADTADAAKALELTPAPDARAQRQPLATEQPLASTHARSALGAQDGRPVEAPARVDGMPPLEVTNPAQTQMPAVAEAAHGGGAWLPAPHSGASTSHAAAQPAAAAGPPVDMRAPNWQEAFASRVQWLTGSHGGEARITLNPPELGAVDVKVSLVEDKTYVQLTAATAAARDELSQSLPRLRELFTASGIELGGASVHGGGPGDRAGHGGERPGAASESRLAPFAELADEPPTAAIPRRSLGRVDVFA